MKTRILLALSLILIPWTNAIAEQLSDYANSKYVADFNYELRDFWERMTVFTDNYGNIFIRSNNTANRKKENYKSIQQNLFFGSNSTVYQIRSSGTSARISRKKLLDLKFTASNYDLEGKMSDENTIELFCKKNIFLGKSLFRLNRITDNTEKERLLSKIKFIPYFPKRVQWFYYEEKGIHKFIDRYKKNLLPGEVRYFEGTSQNMEYHKVKKVVAFDCDRNPIFVLESGKRIEFPQQVHGVHRPHHINGSKLGISASISNYPDLPKSSNIGIKCKNILNKKNQ